MRYCNTQNAQIPQKQDGHNIHPIMKTVCPPGYHHNGFVETNAFRHMMYGSTFLVPMNQRALNKLSKVHNISDHKWSTKTLTAKISQNQDGHNIYATMKTICRPGCHHTNFLATHALGHMIYGYTFLVPMNQRLFQKLSKGHNISGHK